MIQHPSGHISGRHVNLVWNVEKKKANGTIVKIKKKEK
jgi:hypothetical protein